LITSGLSVRWLCGVSGALVLLAQVPGYGAAVIAGADLSHLKFFEDRDIVYRAENGPRDALAIFRDRGLNCARLRLFTSSAQQADDDPYNAINNLAYTVPLAVRVKNAGLQLLLDFHYSDSWADPGKQTKPAAWATQRFPELEQALYEYTRDSIVSFREAGAMPDYVQVGNEIIGGFLWPEGRLGGTSDTAVQWSQLGRLLKAAIRGVNDGAGNTPPAIVIHIDRGADWGATQWFFDRLLREQVEFDVIGQSYYPFWHGSLNDLRTCLNQAAVRYGKRVLIVETTFPWDGSGSIEGIPATAAGQAQYVVELAKVLASVSGGRGMGIVWWGAEYVRLPGYNLAGFDRRSFFDFSGQALPVVGVLGQLTEPIQVRVVHTSDGLVLDWPLSGVGMVLTTTPSLAIPTIWSSLDTVPEWKGSSFSATLPVDDPYRLFRLEIR